MYIYLQVPCQVSEICLTIAHGQSDQTTPTSIDLFIGPYVNSLSVVFQVEKL